MTAQLTNWFEGLVLCSKAARARTANDSGDRNEDKGCPPYPWFRSSDAAAILPRLLERCRGVRGGGRRSRLWFRDWRGRRPGLVVGCCRRAQRAECAHRRVQEGSPGRAGEQQW